jgi:hypothetical protein
MERTSPPANTPRRPSVLSNRGRVRGRGRTTTFYPIRGAMYSPQVRGRSSARFFRPAQYSTEIIQNGRPWPKRVVLSSGHSQAQH